MGEDPILEFNMFGSTVNVGSGTGDTEIGTGGGLVVTTDPDV